MLPLLEACLFNVTSMTEICKCDSNFLSNKTNIKNKNLEKSSINCY